MIKFDYSFLGLDGKRHELSHADLADFDLSVSGVVEPGHGVASGKNPKSKYPKGTVVLQYPFFKQLGVDLGGCYAGTLNISIAPRRFEIINAWKELTAVIWYENRAPEDFKICHCGVRFGDFSIRGFLYYPDPRTKIEYIDKPTQIQVIAPYLPNLSYGSAVELLLSTAEVKLY